MKRIFSCLLATLVLGGCATFLPTQRAKTVTMDEGARAPVGHSRYGINFTVWPQINCATNTPCTASGPVNTHTGDSLYSAANKINENIAQLANMFGTSSNLALNGSVSAADIVSRFSGCSSLTPALGYQGTCISGGGGSQVYPGAGIANSTGTAWGTSYSATNLIPANFETVQTFTGDCTNSGGLTLTCSKVNGASIPLSAAALSTNALNQIIAATTTGTGAVVLANSPVLVTPNLGVPSAVDLSNATNLAATALPASGVTAGSYTNANITVDAYGRVTVAANGTTSGITLQTGGTNNKSQTALNLVGTGNISVTNPTGSEVDIGPVSEPVNAQGTPAGNAYTVASTDCGKQITFNDASAVAVTVPQATGSFASCQFDVTNLGAGSVTLTPTTSTINGAASLAIAQNRQCTVNSDGTNYQVIGCNALVSSSAGFTLENAGTSLGTVTTLNCSTGTTCSASGGVGTLTASGGSGLTSAILPFGSAVSTSAGATEYYTDGTQGATATIGALVARDTTFTALTYYQSTATAGSATVVTFYFGTPGSMAASTTLTCTVAVGTHSCNVSASQLVTANSAFAVQVNNAGTAATSNVMLGLTYQ